MTVWERTDFRDEHAEDGEGVILLPDGRVVAVSVLAWSVLAHLSEGASDEAGVVQVLAALHGRPVDESGNDLTTLLTSQMLSDLQEAGLVAPISASKVPDEGGSPFGGLA